MKLLLPACVLGVLLSAGAHAGYLREGPPQLRVARGDSAPPALSLLPPVSSGLPTQEEKPAAPATSDIPPAEEPAAPLDLLTPLLPTLPPEPTPASATPVPESSGAGAETSLTPQALIRFFGVPGTNAEVNLVTPVFTPPTPPSRSSTATYESR